MEARRCGIYVHIPFCRRKCLYCGFYSEGCVRADWPRLVDALISELHMRRDEIFPGREFTLYFGGGTPSLLPADEFLRLADGLSREITGCVPQASFVETTIEVNPDDVTPELADAWKRGGVDRVSMGVQSLVDTELKIIGRRHDARRAREAFDTLRSRFSNISLDLMFGLPGQTLDSLALTVDGFIGMNPEHISSYSLTYEERTALTRLRDCGRIAETPEEASVDMFRLIDSRLAEAGYSRYEISNYCKPGYRSRHNSSYWHSLPYIGLGPSAHSYDGRNRRSWNVADTARYLDFMAAGERPSEEETLGPEELREEYVLTALRTAEGICLPTYRRRFGEEATRRLLRDAAPQISAGLLRRDGESLSLTPRGVMLSDEVIVSLM